MLEDLVRRMVAARQAVFAANEKAIQTWVAKTQVPREERKRSGSTTPEPSPKRTAYAPTTQMAGTEEKSTRSRARTAAKVRERGGVKTANSTAQMLYDKVLRSPYQAEKTPLLLNVFNFVTDNSPHAVEDSKRRTIDFGKVEPTVAQQVVATISSHHRKTWIPREKLKPGRMEDKIAEVQKKLDQYKQLDKLKGDAFRKAFEELKWGKYALPPEEDYEEWTSSDDEVLFDEALGARVDAMRNVK